jgi:hypothetical protein
MLGIFYDLDCQNVKSFYSLSLEGEGQGEGVKL